MIRTGWSNRTNFYVNKAKIRRNALVIEGTRIGIWDWNIQTGATYFNERWADIIGYTLEELEPVSIETWIQFAHPDDLEESNRLLQEHFEGKSEYYDFHSRMQHKNGTWIWVHDRGKVFEWDDVGQPLRMCGSHIDITEIKTLEFELKRSLQEKNILLSEVHHRVKNNLQTIKSLVSLKQNDQGYIAGAEIQKSINAIASAHEALYKSDRFDKIQLGAYIERIIAPYLLGDQIDISIGTTDAEFPIARIIPIGLIVAECVVNSVKHGFDDNSAEPRVSISFEKTADTLKIEVADNGKGYPDTVLEKHSSATTFGLQIIKALAGQIDASLRLDNREGAVTTIELKLDTV
jgi:PAS domain S-box-containing protein